MPAPLFRRAVSGLLFTVVLAGCGSHPEPAAGPRAVLVAHPVDGRETPGLAFAGEVRAREESPLSFRVGGSLIERRVDVGDHVRRGDVLAALDPRDLQAQAHAAQAQLAAAEAQLQRARADQGRLARLGREQLVSRSAVDAQNAAASAAQGQVTAARAGFDVARNQAAYTWLRAPRDGVIAARQAEAGQVVASGQAVFTLAADSGRDVLFAVPEGVVRDVVPGQPVRIVLWSQPGRWIPGRVREVAPAADPATRTYAVRATVDANAAVELGQSARVQLQGATPAELAVPLGAVQRIVGGGAGVYVVEPGSAVVRLRPVQLGPYGTDAVPVIRGLDPQDWVVIAGGHLLREGEHVLPVDRDNRPVRR